MGDFLMVWCKVLLYLFMIVDSSLKHLASLFSNISFLNNFFLVSMNRSAMLGPLSVNL